MYCGGRKQISRLKRNLKTKKTMATLNQVQKSMGASGSPQQPSLEQDIVRTAIDNAPKAAGVEYVIFKLVNTKKKGRVHIDGIDDVVNPKTGKLERIWLLGGGVQSIWQSDLTETLKDKDFVRQNRRSLTFEGKVLRIPSWDTPALEFARACRHNIDNPKRRTGSKTEFFEYNPAKQQEEALKKELLEMDMAFGISFVDELGQAKTDDGIRRELMLIAKRDPKRFEKAIGSKEVDIAFLVKKAILDAKIDLGNGNAIWSGNGGFIAKIPAARKPLEYLIELAMTNSDEGRAFLEQLNTFAK
jgi:hypothetical protein